MTLDDIHNEDFYFKPSDDAVFANAMQRHAEAFTSIDMYDVLSELDHGAVLVLVRAGDALAIGRMVIDAQKAMLRRLAEMAVEA